MRAAAILLAGLMFGGAAFWYSAPDAVKSAFSYVRDQLNVPSSAVASSTSQLVSFSFNYRSDKEICDTLILRSTFPREKRTDYAGRVEEYERRQASANRFRIIVGANCSCYAAQVRRYLGEADFSCYAAKIKMSDAGERLKEKFGGELPKVHPKELDEEMGQIYNAKRAACGFPPVTSESRGWVGDDLDHDAEVDQRMSIALEAAGKNCAL